LEILSWSSFTIDTAFLLLWIVKTCRSLPLLLGLDSGEEGSRRIFPKKEDFRRKEGGDKVDVCTFFVIQ